EVARRLEQAGFDRLFEEDSWSSAHEGAKKKDGVDKFFVWREGSIVAWVAPQDVAPETGFRFVGAHTDSPNLRIKPRPDKNSASYMQLGVEVYGGVLLNSWLDRDLGLSGRVAVRSSAGTDLRLFRVDEPILRVPQLAIHLDREIYSSGLQLNKQRHMSPVWGLGKSSEGDFKAWLAGQVEAEAKDVLSWDAMCHDTNPSTVWGRSKEFVSAPRLDNLASCYAGLSAMLARLAEGTPLKHVIGVSFFDHEEVGSGSHRGADGSLLRDLLERSVIARGGSREDSHRAIANSVCVSADMAHATHPNYVDRHEPDHFLEINAGPVIKINANMRYATDAGTEAVFQTACEEAGVPFQKWVNRTDLACGSTIGPMTAAGTGMRVVD
ncbi:MAG: M18 family aminopeptidase, partial [Planctomycetota bacterium]